jgi:filamentous hemagglutinin
MFQYRQNINGQDIDVIVKEKCDLICKAVKKSKASLKINDYPAVAVGCCRNDNNRLFVETTKSRKDYARTPNLEQALNGIGGIGTIQNGNVVGGCAEPKAAFEVIINHHCNIDDLKFSTAIRPRTKGRVEYCANCRNVFDL